MNERNSEWPLKREQFAQKGIKYSEELVENILDIWREERKRLEAEGFSDLEIAEKLIGSKKKKRDEIYWE